MGTVNGGKKTGVIFDMLHASFNDGPGLRSTIFFKGCPLRCIWCHNPESYNKQPEISYNEALCSCCGRCADVCVKGCHSFSDGIHTFIRTACELCGKCAVECPNNALETKGYEISAEEVAAFICRDMAYYEATGGGVTLSGGETMMQPDFAYEILWLSKQKGVHTAVETCGYAPEAAFQKIIAVTDLFLFDYKATGEELHKKLTGVGQERILGNLAFLCSRGKEVILRCPMVQTVNDSDIHLKTIAEISNQYDGIHQVDILPYHNMGEHKSGRLGKAPMMSGFTSASEEDKERWDKKLRGFGCKNFTVM